MSNCNKLKQFWTKQIKTLRDREDMHTTKNQGNYALRPDHSDWENKLNALSTLQEINDYALFLAIKIYKRNQKLFSPFGVPYNDLDSLLKWLKIEKEYRQVLLAEIKDYEQATNSLQNQLDSYKNTWDGHTCPTCPHSDYDAIKTERDNLKTTNTNLTQEKTNLQTERDHLKDQLAGKTDFDKIEQDIAKQIITDSGLDLTPDSKLEQLITKIKDLIKQPDNQERERERTITDLQTQIKNQEQTIADLKKPNEEIMKELKQKIKQKWQELGLSNPDLEKSLTEAQTYQQLVDLEQKTFATKWKENQLLLYTANKDKVNLKGGLIASVIVISAIVLGGLSYGLLRKKRVKRKRNL